MTDSLRIDVTRAITAWGLGSAVIVAALAAGAILDTRTPVLGMAVQIGVGAIGVAWGAYRSTGAVPADRRPPGSARRRAFAWAIALAAASLLAWYWEPLSRVGFLPVDQHAVGNGRWSSSGSPDPGPLSWRWCPVLFGALGGLLAGLVTRPRPSSVPPALVNSIAWAAGCGLASHVILAGVYVAGGLLATLFGSVYRPLAVVGMLLGSGVTGFVAGCAAGIIAMPVEWFIVWRPIVASTRTTLR